MFERIFRFSGKIETIYLGMGKGLFTASEIIKIYKGQIGAQSEQGEGSTFYFSLPII